MEKEIIKKEIIKRVTNFFKGYYSFISSSNELDNIYNIEIRFYKSDLKYNIVIFSEEKDHLKVLSGTVQKYNFKVNDIYPETVKNLLETNSFYIRISLLFLFILEVIKLKLEYINNKQITNSNLYIFKKGWLNPKIYFTIINIKIIKKIKCLIKNKI